MEYKCKNIGMVRCATLHKGILKQLLCDDFDINNTVEFVLNGNLGIKPDYLKMAIRISSESLYRSLDNYETLKKSIKKKQQANISLYKYLVRMASRAVPFGEFSAVGLFEFGTKTQIEFDNGVFNYSIKLDKEWLNNILYNLEKDKCNIENSELFLNDNIYCIGNTYKNPYHSGFGLQKDLSGAEMGEFGATSAFLLAKPLLKKGISYKDLLAIFKKEYKDVPNEIVYSMLRSLIEMEFVYTNLRPFANMNDEDILKLLIDQKNNPKILLIEEIINKLAFVKKDGNLIPCNLNKVIDEMKEVCISQSFVKVDKGLKLIDNKVDDKIKIRIEKFVNTISKIPLKIMDDGINSIITCFLDIVGYDVLVPLIMAIDSTRFGILELDNEKPMNPTDVIDSRLRSLIDRKIQLALMENLDCITVSEDEIDNLYLDIDKQINEKYLVNSMDLAFILTGENGKEELSLSPNIGSTKMGNYFQRFSDVFDSKQFEKFLYNYEENTSNIEIKTIEAFEMEKIGHVNNICKSKKRYENSISLGYRHFKEMGDIKLSDLYLFVSSKNNKLYIYCKKLNSLCRVIADDMLNYESNGQVLKLLKKISYHYENYKIVERLAALYANSYIYVPRILIEGIYVSRKKWKLNSDLIRSNSKDIFEMDFNKYCQRFNVPSLVYIEQFDNRLLVNLKNETSLTILYNSFKSNGYLLLAEIENKIMEDLDVKDITGNSYSTELIFSLSKKMNKVENESNLTEGLSYLEETDLIFHPFEKGWVYIKIYGISKHNENKVLLEIFELNQSYDLKNCFFIRYVDKLGNHLRIRYKFENTEEAMHYYKIISVKLGSLYDEGIIGNWTVNDYIRETNRYGGIKNIGLLEELFMCESRMVISILYKEEDEFLKYCIGIVSILKAVFKDDFEAMYNFLTQRFKPRNVDKNMHNQARKYLSNVLALFRSINKADEEQYEYFERIKKIFYNTDLEYVNNGEIVFSVIHMYANRLFGNVEQEFAMNNLFVKILKSIKTIYNI